MDEEQPIGLPSLKIEINGQAYESVEQMPPAIREEYLRLVAKLGDKDGNGIPDALEQGGSQTIVEQRYVINGKEYRDLSEVPPEHRKMIEQMKHLKPGESVNVVETDTKVIGPDGRLTDWEEVPKATSPGFGYWLIGFLLAVVVVVFFLWVSGVRPAGLLHR